MRNLLRSTLLVLVCMLAPASVITGAGVSDDEYRVYEAVIRHMYRDGKLQFDMGRPTVKLLVIRSDTKTDGDSEPLPIWIDNQLKQTMPSANVEVIAAFRRDGSRQATIKNKFKIDLFRYAIFSGDEHARLFGKMTFDESASRWESFYRQYPDSYGYISFSRVGFDKKKTMALVFFEHWCRELCGSGHYLVVSKTNDTWNVAAATMIWIS